MANLTGRRRPEIDLICIAVEAVGLHYSLVIEQNLGSGEFRVIEEHVARVGRAFLERGVQCRVLKEPGSFDDSVIFLLGNAGTTTCLKVLPDVWLGMAEHTRNDGYLEKMSASRYLPDIHYVRLDFANQSISYLYDFVEGVTLSRMLERATVSERLRILATLNRCITEWVAEYGLDVNLNDLDNLLVDPTDLSSIVLTDLNIAFQASDLVSRSDLLRVVKRRALRVLSDSGFDWPDVYAALYA